MDKFFERQMVKGHSGRNRKPRFIIIKEVEITVL